LSEAKNGILAVSTAVVFKNLDLVKSSASGCKPGFCPILKKLLNLNMLHFAILKRSTGK
jgi:hypothetical protein